MIDFDGLTLGPCMQAYGEEVLYEPTDGPSYHIKGIFDDTFVPTLPDDGTELTPSHITSYSAVLGVQLSQMHALPVKDDGLTVREQAFTVREARADGRGSMLLMLKFRDVDDDPLPPLIA
ncbi:head-tail joining protein [Asaia astilbis]|uniref:head-tail joining protein n=1 Tax=Asaia astilbis TaxID=610244 RepID=UPI0004713B0C|nr:hypothetical protein [Asaia astilbis]